MNYSKIYNNLIKKRQDSPAEEGEIHHILPRSMGGSNDKSNLVKLTYREHFFAHLLLYKIHRNKETSQAFCMMALINNHNKRNYNVCTTFNNLAIRLSSENTLLSWATPESRAKRIKALNTKEATTKMSMASIAYHSNPDNKEQHIIATTLAQNRAEVKLKKSLKMKEYYNNPENLELMKIRNKEINSRPEVKEALSIASKKAKRKSPIWQEPMMSNIRDLWKLNTELKAPTFRKLAINNGFPDVDYRAIICRFKQGE